MKSTKKIWLFTLLILLLTISACGGQTVAEAEAEAAEADADTTEIDPVAIFTSAAGTVAAQLTETAISFSPTPEPATATLTPIPPTATLVDLNQTPLANPTVGFLEPTSTFPAGVPTFTPGLPTLIPTATQPALATVAGPICDKMIYGSPLDITIPDDTIMAPGEDFYKIWRIYNDGVCTWDDGYQLAVVSGASSLDAANPAWELNALIAPGEVVDVGAYLTAPLAVGTYETCFLMQNDRGVYFGGYLCVRIKVSN